MKRNIEHAWTTATLIATAALAIALAIVAVVFTRASTTSAPPPQTQRFGPIAPPAILPARTARQERRLQNGPTFDL